MTSRDEYGKKKGSLPVTCRLLLLLLAMCMCALVLSVVGCYPMAVEMNRLVGLDCSQAALQQNQGRCVTATKKGE
jgi:hypothetical protein